MNNPAALLVDPVLNDSKPRLAIAKLPTRYWLLVIISWNAEADIAYRNIIAAINTIYHV